MRYIQLCAIIGSRFRVFSDWKKKIIYVKIASRWEQVRVLNVARPTRGVKDSTDSTIVKKEKKKITDRTHPRTKWHAIVRGFRDEHAPLLVFSRKDDDLSSFRANRAFLLPVESTYATHAKTLSTHMFIKLIIFLCFVTVLYEIYCKIRYLKD